MDRKRNVWGAGRAGSAFVSPSGPHRSRQSPNKRSDGRRKPASSMPSMDKNSRLIVEANEIAQLLKKDYEFVMCGEPSQDEHLIEVRVRKKELGISCLWMLTKLKERLIKMRSLMYADESEGEGFGSESVFFDAKDVWIKDSEFDELYSKDSNDTPTHDTPAHDTPAHDTPTHDSQRHDAQTNSPSKVKDTSALSTNSHEKMRALEEVGVMEETDEQTDDESQVVVNGGGKPVKSPALHTLQSPFIDLHSKQNHSDLHLKQSVNHSDLHPKQTANPSDLHPKQTVNPSDLHPKQTVNHSDLHTKETVNYNDLRPKQTINHKDLHPKQTVNHSDVHPKPDQGRDDVSVATSTGAETMSVETALPSVSTSVAFTSSPENSQIDGSGMFNLMNGGSFNSTTSSELVADSEFIAMPTVSCISPPPPPGRDFGVNSGSSGALPDVYFTSSVPVNSSREIALKNKEKVMSTSSSASDGNDARNTSPSPDRKSSSQRQHHTPIIKTRSPNITPLPSKKNNKAKKKNSGGSGVTTQSLTLQKSPAQIAGKGYRTSPKQTSVSKTGSPTKVAWMPTSKHSLTSTASEAMSSNLTSVKKVFSPPPRVKVDSTTSEDLSPTSRSGRFGFGGKTTQSRSSPTAPINTSPSLKSAACDVPNSNNLHGQVRNIVNSLESVSVGKRNSPLSHVSSGLRNDGLLADSDSTVDYQSTASVDQLRQLVCHKCGSGVDSGGGSGGVNSSVSGRTSPVKSKPEKKTISMIRMCRDMVQTLVHRTKGSPDNLVDRILYNCEVIKVAVINILDAYMQAQDNHGHVGGFVDCELMKLTSIQLVAALELLLSHTSLWVMSYSEVESRMVRDMCTQIRRLVREIGKEMVVFLQACETDQDIHSSESATKIIDQIYSLVNHCGELSLATETQPVLLLEKKKTSLEELNLKMLRKQRVDDLLHMKPSFDMIQSFMIGCDMWIDRHLQRTTLTLEHSERHAQMLSEDCYANQCSEEVGKQVYIVVATSKILVLKCHDVQGEVSAYMKSDCSKPDDYFHHYFQRNQGLVSNLLTMVDSVTLLCQAADPLADGEEQGSLRKVCRCAEMIEKAVVKLVRSTTYTTRHQRHPSEDSLLTSMSSKSSLNGGLSSSDPKSLKLSSSDNRGSSVLLSESQCDQIEQCGDDVKLAIQQLGDLIRLRLPADLTASSATKVKRMLPATPGGQHMRQLRCKSAKYPSEKMKRSISYFNVGSNNDL